MLNCTVHIFETLSWQQHHVIQKHLLNFVTTILSPRLVLNVIAFKFSNTVKVCGMPFPDLKSCILLYPINHSQQLLQEFHDLPVGVDDSESSDSDSGRRISIEPSMMKKKQPQDFSLEVID